MTSPTSTGFPNGVRFSENEADVILKSPGLPGFQYLRVAANVASDETVTIGADVYRVAVVNTDLDVNVVGSELDNVETQVVVTLGAGHGLIPGDLIRCENEIMEVIQNVGPAQVMVKRGVSGTTIAAHAADTDLYGEAAPGDGGIAVGVVSTLTPAVFTDRLTADINNRGRANVKAYAPDDNTVVVATAKSPGGDPIPSETDIAVSETLAGSGNAWDAANITGGYLAGTLQIIPIIPTAAEDTANVLYRVLNFTPVVIGLLMIVTATRDVAACDATVTVSGNLVTINQAGSSDWAATNTLFLICRD